MPHIMNRDDLRAKLISIDGSGYKAYKSIRGHYSFEGFVLFIDHVQGDPFAAPSRVRVQVEPDTAGYPPHTFSSSARSTALASYLAEEFSTAVKSLSGRRGSGKSGLLEIDCPGQEVLKRTAVIVTEGRVEARFRVGLPAAGRRVLGRVAAGMLCDDLPGLVSRALRYGSNDREMIERYIMVNEDADHLRHELDKFGLVAFISQGSVLPRCSGIDDRPLTEGHVVPLSVPPSLSVEIDLPNTGRITGMGIPRGVTLIAGGGFHGKSTVLEALQRGVYNHKPGDGREFVVSNPATVKIRAEDGRRVEGVDISAFINDLPFGRDTYHFSSDNASGSTSQAANIVEALEVGARVLLIDEDTAATNFMIRDHRMQELVAKAKEPITPFIDRVKQIYQEQGVSTILVIGGSGDYFDVADTVIAMEEYEPRDVTAQARIIADRFSSERLSEAKGSFGSIIPRIPDPRSIDPRKGKHEAKVKTRGLKTINFGTETIDISAVEQLVDTSQTRALADALLYARKRYIDGKRSVSELMDLVMGDIYAHGLDILSSYPIGEYALFRRSELAAALNRLRTLKVHQRR